MRLAFRTAWPPAIAVVGVLPFLLGRHAVEQGDPGAGGALPAAVLVAVLFAGVCGWVRVRDEIAEWFRAQMEQANARA